MGHILSRGPKSPLMCLGNVQYLYFPHVYDAASGLDAVINLDDLIEERKDFHASTNDMDTSCLSYEQREA